MELAPASQKSEALKTLVSVRAASTGASKPAGWSGTKGLGIVRWLSDNPEMTAAQIAKEVGCSVARIGEVKVALKLGGLAPAEALAKAAGTPSAARAHEHASRPLAVVTTDPSGCPSPKPRPKRSALRRPARRAS